MPFEAKALRVQLPCGPVTVIEAERADAEIQAREYWRTLLTPGLNNPDCGPGTGCGFHSGFGELCKASDPIEVLTVIDAHVLPILKEQLEAKLREIDSAMRAVRDRTNG